jgi:hypothetical protein
LELGLRDSSPDVQTEGFNTNGDYTVSQVKMKWPGEKTTVSARFFAPRRLLNNPAPKVVVLAQPDSSLSTTNGSKPAGLAKILLEHGLGVFQITQATPTLGTNQFANFYSTYNRTVLQNHVRDLVGACSAVQTAETRPHPRFRVILLGAGEAGIWALMAAPAADAVAADANETDVSEDSMLLSRELFSPGLRNIGTFEGAPALAAPHPLLLHHTGEKFPTSVIRSGYNAADASNYLTIDPKPRNDQALARWITAL